MPTGYVLTCAVAPVDGLCPQGSQEWVSATRADAFAMPSPAELSAAFDAAISVFFWPTMVALMAALAVRWISEQIS